MTTIREIAAIVGVSRGTVDRVINNRGGVKPETEARIRQAIESLNYSPNIAGKSLAIKRKELKFGIIFRYDNPRYQITDFVRRKARDFLAYGIETIMLEANIDDPQSYVTAFDQLKERGVCGAIVMPDNNPAVIEKMKEMQQNGMVIVTIETLLDHFECLTSIGTDFYRCGEVIGSMLGLITSRGGNTAIVTFPKEREKAARREAGVLKRLSDEYPEVRIADILRMEDDEFIGYTRTKELLAAHPEIESVFINSTSVVGVCRAIEELGRRIKVLCFDSIALPAVHELVDRGVIHVIVSQRSQLQATIAMDTLFHYFVYGTMPQCSTVYTNVEINIAGNLDG